MIAKDHWLTSRNADSCCLSIKKRAGKSQLLSSVFDCLIELAVSAETNLGKDAFSGEQFCA